MSPEAAALKIPTAYHDTEYTGPDIPCVIRTISQRMNLNGTQICYLILVAPPLDQRRFLIA